MCRSGPTATLASPNCGAIPALEARRPRKAPPPRNLACRSPYAWADYRPSGEAARRASTMAAARAMLPGAEGFTRNINSWRARISISLGSYDHMTTSDPFGHANLPVNWQSRPQADRRIQLWLPRGT